jgi:YidC/Oxa1 family membrane protein insertase
MDKKNIAIGIGAVVIALTLIFLNPRRNEGPPAAGQAAPAASQLVPAAVAEPSSPQPAPAKAGQLLALENGTLRLNIALKGGGIRDIALLAHADSLMHRHKPAEHPYLFNASGVSDALSFSVDNSSNPYGPPLPWEPDFTVVAHVPGRRAEIVATFPDGHRLTRSYELLPAGEKGEPYLVRVHTTFRAGSVPMPAVSPLRLNTGTLPPTEGDAQNQFLGIATYDGSEFAKTSVSEFVSSSGFLGIGAHDALPEVKRYPGGQPWQWVSVTNQYFAGIIQFDKEMRSLVRDMRVTPLRKAPLPGSIPQVYTSTGDIGLMLPQIQPGQELSFGTDYYVGPREYSRLADLGGGQEKAVQFSKLYFISVDPLCKLFVVVLDLLHSLIPASIASAWGVAIILLTIIIKALTWPLVSMQQRSAERMRQFQGPMKAIRERYKDDARRQQQEMMKLYQEHKINPLAGCWPVLIQIPVFTGLFFTFQSLAQLRFQSFLWIPDLSMPDVIPGLETIYGFPVHILPVFMGVTMLLNMRLMPMPNAEGQQKVIFYGMMIMFPIICYGMPSALMLYYSVQNVLTIFQTLITRRRMRGELAPSPVAVAPAKALPSSKAARKK